jgi:hypothetical protein
MKKIALFCLFITFNSFSCDENPLPAFGSLIYPDMPFNNFATGNLGIITPYLGTSYLFVAYRYLNHLPLNTAEQSAALAGWSDYFGPYQTYFEPVCPLLDTGEKHRVTDYWDLDELIDSSNIARFIDKFIKKNKVYFNWRKYRLRVLGLPTKIPVPVMEPGIKYSLYDIDSFYSHLALKEDNINYISAGPGFNYLVLATERLRRIKDVLDKQNSLTDSINENGAQETEQSMNNEKEVLFIWINAQQQIFKRTMASSEKARKLLALLPDNVPQLLKDDIQYSIAASYLYDGTANGAKIAAQKFEILAKSNTYPWHEWAKYLQYRALNIAVSKTVHSGDEIEVSVDIDAVCAEKTPCRRMSDQSYEGMFDLSKNATDPQIKEAADDYANLILMRTKWRAPKFYETLLQNSLTNIDEKSFNHLIALSQDLMVGTSNEVSSWFTDVMIVRGNDYNGRHASLINTIFTDAYSHWKNNPENLAWLWLAVYTMKNSELNQQRTLTQAVLKLSSQDPAFVPLRIALIAHFGDLKDPAMKMSQKRSLIDATLAVLPVGGDFSTTKFLLNARANFANSFSDFVKHAFFYPKKMLLACGSQIAHDSKQLDENYMIANAATIINTLPPSLLIQMAGMSGLPNNYRPVIYANLWVRSILFNDTNLEKAVSKDAMKYNPVLTHTIKKMGQTNDIDERKTLFLSALLHFPNLSPIINLTQYETWHGDGLDNSSPIFKNIVLRHERFDKSNNNWLWFKCDTNCKTSIMPEFLTSGQIKEYHAQLKQLTHMESASSYVGDSLIALANHYPNDLRYAQLLALFINYTKYTTGGSKKAFITLKKLYPDSYWAKKTKYYY